MWGQGWESPTATPRTLPAASKHGASSEIESYQLNKKLIKFSRCSQCCDAVLVRGITMLLVHLEIPELNLPSWSGGHGETLEGSSHPGQGVLIRRQAGWVTNGDTVSKIRSLAGKSWDSPSGEGTVLGGEAGAVL